MAKRGLKLKTVADVNTALGRVFNQLYKGEIQESKAGKLAYILNVMIKGLEVGDLEKRLTKLEEQQTND